MIWLQHTQAMIDLYAMPNQYSPFIHFGIHNLDYSFWHVLNFVPFNLHFWPHFSNLFPTVCTCIMLDSNFHKFVPSYPWSPQVPPFRFLLADLRVRYSHSEFLQIIPKLVMLFLKPQPVILQETQQSHLEYYQATSQGFIFQIQLEFWQSWVQK